MVIFLGHANSTAKDINYNLLGTDITLSEMQSHLKTEKISGKLGIIWALEAGTRATKILGAKNRLILAAAETEDRDNEPALNEVIDKLFEPNAADKNGDKLVSLAEMQVVAKQQIREWYQERGLVQLEKIILDGNGDGIGTVAPSPLDKEEAKNITINF